MWNVWCLSYESNWRIAQKEEELVATTMLGAALNSLISEPRPVMMDRILVVEDDGAMRKILLRLFSSEGYEVDVVPDVVCGLERLRQERQRQWSSIYLVRDPQGVIFAGKLPI